MHSRIHWQDEHRYAAFAVIASVAVAALMSPKDSVQAFLANMAWFWLPQLVVLLCLWLFKARPAMTAGVSAGMAAYLASFGL